MSGTKFGPEGERVSSGQLLERSRFSADSTSRALFLFLGELPRSLDKLQQLPRQPNDEQQLQIYSLEHNRASAIKSGQPTGARRHNKAKPAGREHLHRPPHPNQPIVRIDLISARCSRNLCNLAVRNPSQRAGGNSVSSEDGTRERTDADGHNLSH